MTKAALPALTALQSFEAAARLGSFTKAADERHLTHSAISRNIQTVEHWCAERLFERYGPKVVLSEAGHRLQQRLSGPLQALHAALEMDDAHETRHGLKVLMLSSIASTWLMPLLPEFTRTYPRICLSVETGYEMMSLPPNQQVVAIRFGHFSRLGLRCQRLWFDKMVAVASPKWVERYGNQAAHWPAKQLLRHTHEPWPHRLVNGALRTGSELAQPAGFEFNDALLLIHAALVGCGVGWVRASLAQTLVANGSLIVLAQSEQLSDKSVWLVCREEVAELSAVREFFGWATEITSLNHGPESNQNFPELKVKIGSGRGSLQSR